MNGSHVFGKAARAALAIGPASAFLALTASAEPPPAPETLDQAALASARAPASTPVAAGLVADRYGMWLQGTIQKFPDLKGAIVGLDGAFFNRQSAPKVNTAVRFADGTEVLLMSGCRNMSLCSETGYLLGCDFSHRQVALIEVENAAQPRSYRFAGSREPTLRALLLEQGSKVFANAAPDPAATMLRGVKVSAATQAMPNLFQAKPDLTASVRRVYPAADSLTANDICGIMMADGRLLTLISALTSNADGEVPHAIASDDRTKRTFVYRAEGQLGHEAWFGNPEGALRTVLSVGANGCTILRGKLGLDPNGRETGPVSDAAPVASSSPASNAAGPAPLGDLECRARDGAKMYEVFVEARGIPCAGSPSGTCSAASVRTTSGGTAAVQPAETTQDRGMFEIYPLHSTVRKPMATLVCTGQEMSGNPVGSGCGSVKKLLQFSDSSPAGWGRALTCE